MARTGPDSARTARAEAPIPFSASALQECLDVPDSDRERIADALERLAADPTDDALNVVPLQGRDKTYRLRVGRWRVFYTLEDELVVEAVRRRQDTTYSARRLATIGSGSTVLRTPDELRPHEEDDEPDDPTLDEELARGAPPSEDEPLPRPLDPETLRRWYVPSAYHDALVACRTADELLGLDIDPRVTSRVLEMLYPSDVAVAAEGPHYLVHGRDELRRWVRGEISRLLLQLDPEQEALVRVQLDGPTLVRGGPGTGKTVVAIHRTLALAARPDVKRILFATFTNALCRYARDLLDHLMRERGIDVDLDVCTVDHLVKKHAPVPKEMVGGAEARKVVEALLEDETDPLLTSLGPRYLFEEFETVIGAQGIDDLGDYLAADRRGREILLMPDERVTVWRVYSAFRSRLDLDGRITWPMLRRHALHRAHPAYDAIVVDEAQDLTPVALRFLVALAKDRRTLHLTADVGQSLYASGFSWRGVHEALDMRGRSHVLRTDHRATRELHAATSELARRLGLERDDPPLPGRRRGPRPRIVACDAEKPYAHLAETLRVACREARLPLGAAAVLAPRKAIVERILFELNEMGIRAEHGRDGPEGVDGPAVKVLPLQSAKGLEYPVVVLFGIDEGVLPRELDAYPDEERIVHRQRDARLLYVGCTRAMRGLMVMHEEGRSSSFLRGSSEAWSTAAPSRT